MSNGDVCFGSWLCAKVKGLHLLVALLLVALKQHRESHYGARSRCIQASTCHVLLINLIYSQGLTLMTLFCPNDLSKIQ